MDALPSAHKSLPRPALGGLLAGQAILLALVFSVASTSLALIAGLTPLPRMAWPIMTGALLAAALWTGSSVRTRAALALWTAALLVICMLGAATFIDGSYDGQEYHYDTIYALSHGWNPFHGPYASFAPPGVTALIWPEHYPVGAPMLTALLRSGGASLAAAKGITWLPGIAVVPIWFALLYGEGMSRSKALPLAILASASPITIEQMRSHYVDGFVAALAMAYIGLLVLALRQRRCDSLICAMACLVLAIDTKFNAIAIFGAICAALCLSLALLHRWRAAFTLGTAMLGALGFVVLIIGAFPYLTNWSRFGHPFYPVMGTDQYGVNEALLPGAVRALPDFVVFAGTTFSVFTRDFAGDPRALFDFSEGGWPDVAIGGFGPVFGIVLLATLAMGLVILRSRLRRATGPDEPQGGALARVLLAIAGMLLISSLVTPYMWWPRFIPQLWICVSLCILAAILSQARWLGRLGWLCAAILAFNSTLVGANSVRNGLSDTAQVRHHIAAVKDHGGPFCAAFGAAHARIELMREAGIHVVPLTSNLPAHCQGAEPIPLADGFLGNPATACPCQQVPGSARATATRPPDTTLADIHRLFERNK